MDTPNRISEPHRITHPANLPSTRRAVASPAAFGVLPDGGSAGFAAQLATRDNDDVCQRYRGEKRADRCEESLVDHDHERRAGQSTNDQAKASQNQAQGERAARGRCAGLAGRGIVIARTAPGLAFFGRVFPWRGCVFHRSSPLLVTSCSPADCPGSACGPAGGSWVAQDVRV